MKDKAAARFILPVEMLLGWLTLVVAIVGGMAGGTLNRALAAAGNEREWMMVYGLVGITKIVMSFVEWRFGRCWIDRTLLLTSRIRAINCFAGAMVWMGGVGWVLVSGHAGTTMMFVMCAPVIIFFNCWSYYENLKVAYALDPRIPTSNLSFHR